MAVIVRELVNDRGDRSEDFVCTTCGDHRLTSEEGSADWGREHSHSKTEERKLLKEQEESIAPQPASNDEMAEDIIAGTTRVGLSVAENDELIREGASSEDAANDSAEAVESGEFGSNAAQTASINPGNPAAAADGTSDSASPTNVADGTPSLPAGKGKKQS